MTRISDMTPLTLNSPTGIYAPVEKTGSTTNYRLDLGALMDLTPQMFGAAGDANATGTTGTDDTAAIQAAIDHLNVLGGGVLYFPAGNYRVTSYLTLYKNVTLIGTGRLASQIVTVMAGGGGATTDLSVRNGSVFYSNWTSNSSTSAEIVVQDLGIVCSNAANVGAAFYDNGGSFIRLSNVRVLGFKYGVIFDQSELADIDLCDFELQTAAGVWLANAADLRAGNSGEFTNRISITRSQFNAAATVYGILDDGGNAHAFTDNNYNGCLSHIRAAGVTGLKISGGEFESATGPSIRFENTSLAGSGVGSCGAVYIGDGAEIIPGGSGQYCILAQSLGSVTLNTIYLGSTSAAKFGGTGNVSAIYAINCFNGGGGATFDGKATNHWEVGDNGTLFAVRTNVPIQYQDTTFSITKVQAPSKFKAFQTVANGASSNAFQSITINGTVVAGTNANFLATATPDIVAFSGWGLRGGTGSNPLIVGNFGVWLENNLATAWAEEIDVNNEGATQAEGSDSGGVGVAINTGSTYSPDTALWVRRQAGAGTGPGFLRGVNLEGVRNVGYRAMAMDATTYPSLSPAAPGTLTFLATGKSSDTQYRFTVNESGVQSWGPGGSTVADTTLQRTGVNALGCSGSFAIGGGTAITKVVAYAPSITPASVAAATVAEQTFTVTGLTTADKVIVNPPSIANATGVAGVRVSAADTLAIRFVNPTAGALTPTSGTYTVIALRS